MVALSVFILFIIFESSKLLSNAVYTYCTLPCPFMCPAQPPRSIDVFQLPPRRPTPIARTSYYDSYADYDETPESEPAPVTKPRQQQPTDPDSPTSPSKQPKPKAKPPPAEDPEPPPRKRNSSPSSPSIQPSRRFFTSLFSIPGAVVDTLISGEITL